MITTANVKPSMVAARATKIAVQMRAEGFPVMGCDAPDLFEMVGLTFRRDTGRLVNFRLAYDDADYDTFRALWEAL